MHFLQEKRLRSKKVRIVCYSISARKEDEEETANCTFCKKRG